MTAQFPEGTGRGPDDSGGDTGLKDRAQDVAGTAGDEGRHVADTARSEAGQVAHEARSQVRTLISEATTQVDEQSRVQKDRLAGTLRTFGDDLGSMADQGGGLAADVAQEVAQRARELATHLQDKEPQDLLEDVRGFARRRPGTFLLGALAAGVVAGRLARGAKAARDQEPGGTPEPPPPTPVPAEPVTETGTPPTGVWTETSTAEAPTYGAPGVAVPPGPGEGPGGSRP